MRIRLLANYEVNEVLAKIEVIVVVLDEVDKASLIM